MAGNRRYYELLKVPTTASEGEIKKAYHKLALQYHPDKAGDDGIEMFKEIREAYDVLSDPDKRQLYDLYGEEGLKVLDNDMMAGFHSYLLKPVHALCLATCCGFVVLFILSFPIMLAIQVDYEQDWNWFVVCIPAFVAEALAVCVVCSGTRNRLPTGERACSITSVLRVCCVTAFNVLVCFKLQEYELNWWFVFLPLLLMEAVNVLQLPYKASGKKYKKVNTDQDLEAQHNPQRRESSSLPEEQEDKQPERARFGIPSLRMAIDTLWHALLLLLVALKLAADLNISWAVTFTPLWAYFAFCVISGILNIRERSEGSVPALLCMSCLLLTMTSILVAPVVLLIRRLDHGAPSLGIIFIPIFVILGSLSCCCFLQSMCLWLKVQEMMNKSENGSEPSSTPPNSAPHTPSAGAHAEQTAPGEPEVVIPTGTILVPPVTIPCAVQPASEPSAAEGID